MWKVKAKIYKVIIRVTGIISKSLRYFLSNISGKHEIKEQQKTAVLATAHIQLIVLMKK
jgi:hypothetical protein